MKISELVKELQEYNPEANVEVIVDDQIPCKNIEIYYSNGPGVKEVIKSSCKTVELRVYIEKEPWINWHGNGA